MVEKSQQHQFDILGSLPVELVAQVVRYLDRTDIVWNQRVRTAAHFLTCTCNLRIFYGF